VIGCDSVVEMQAGGRDGKKLGLPPLLDEPATQVTASH
jgi:hypothetical protein